MGKIGRNEQCPCGSGRKFKHCCLLKEQAGVAPASPEAALKISLVREIEAIQQAAKDKRQKIKELGVFILLATAEGDAWLLELTESDAVQLSQAGEPLGIPIDENPETIEINWSHTFDLSNKQFELTAYSDKSKTLMKNYPTKEISASIKRIKKRFSSELLQRVHVDPETVEQAA
ncbi:MAG: SEC-C domain-containing protein [Proteobacteria bacterium]|nr:SEC-C domain-containing protein [Pseudomonadota bacterium]MBU1140099.1 SEC-C domain-containing protein [Pseudomonadota bacterium]MBU1231545.1 SEC-C domain-containing protein [Pseudomonadota bacterium]MBU1418108.1 SEC-C domain-containing protein [Pseudomonadota bacterium]MBU1453296.1 SEC-C domain-containing protein [Pseudomonadota bacterium]